MSRPPATPKLPSIAVEDENVKRSISIPRELDEELAAYTEYFQAHSGKKPRSLDDVIVGLLNAYLTGDVLFQKWKKDRTGHANGAGNGTFAAKGKAARAAAPEASPLNGAATS
jgi:hypothetical protein